MSRLPALAATVLIAAASVAQPVAPDSVARLPAFGVPLTGDFEPPQTSAALAYVVTAAATAGPILAGVALDDLLGASPETGGERPTVITLVLVGAWVGPHVGNLTLGAGQDVRRGFALAAGGFLAGTALAAGAIVVGGVCLLEDLTQGGIGSEGCVAGPLVTVLLVSAAALAAAGTLAGAGYGLATIPRNAARAQRYRQSYPRVAVAPGWRSGGPALSVRVGL